MPALAAAVWHCWPVFCLRYAARPARTVLRAAHYLLTVRAVFPWPLRLLLIVGCIQIPVLPVDEVALVVAVVWIVLRYRRLMRVVWRAAQLDQRA